MKKIVSLTLSVAIAVTSILPDAYALRPLAYNNAIKHKDGNSLVSAKVTQVQLKTREERSPTKVAKTKSFHSALVTLRKFLIKFTISVFLLLSIAAFINGARQNFVSSFSDISYQSNLTYDVNGYAVTTEVKTYLEEAIKKDCFVYIFYGFHGGFDDFDKEIKPALYELFEVAKKENKTLIIINEDSPAFPDELINIEGRDPFKKIFLNEEYEKKILDYIEEDLRDRHRIKDERLWREHGKEILQILKDHPFPLFSTGLYLFLIEMAINDYDFIMLSEWTSQEVYLLGLDIDILRELEKEETDSYKKDQTRDLCKRYYDERQILRDRIQAESIDKKFQAAPYLAIGILRGSAHVNLQKILANSGYNVSSYISKAHKLKTDELDQFKAEMDNYLEENKKKMEEFEKKHQKIENIIFSSFLLLALFTLIRNILKIAKKSTTGDIADRDENHPGDDSFDSDKRKMPRDSLAKELSSVKSSKLSRPRPSKSDLLFKDLPKTEQVDLRTVQDEFLSAA